MLLPFVCRRVLLISLLPLGIAISGCLPVVAAAVLGVLEVLDDEGKGNRPPSVILEEVVRDGAATAVEFELRAIDAEGDEIELEVHYSVDAGPWQPASVAPTTVPSSPGGIASTLTWDAEGDLGSSAFRDDLRLRVIPFDGEETGAPAVSNVFAYGNDAPVVDSVSVDETDGVVSGTATVRFVVSDPGSDPVDLTKFELSLSGDFEVDAEEIAITTGSEGNFPVGAVSGLASNEAGTEHTIGWNSFESAQVYSDTARLRLRVTDEHGAESEWASSQLFVLDNQAAPAVQIVDIKESQPGGLRTGPIPIVLRIEDEESDVVDLDVQFSTDGETWFRCTEYRNGRSAGWRDLFTRRAADGGLEQVFAWDASRDLYAFQPEVRLRARAHDGWQSSLYYEYPVSFQAGSDATVEPFAEPRLLQSTPYRDAGVVADFNNNGIDDLAMVATFGDNLEVFLGQRDGLPVSSFSTSVSHNPGSVAAADVNGNANLDLIVRSEDETQWFPGNGDGTFGSPTRIDTLFEFFEVASIAVADFNDNGRPDFAVNADGNIEVWLNDGSGNFPEVDRVGFSLDGITRAVRAGDVTDNGHADIVVLTWSTLVNNQHEDVVQVFEGNGDGTFATSPILLVPEVWLNGLDLADLTGNGRPDIVAATWVSRAHIFLSEGGAQFEDYGSISMGIGEPNRGDVVTADISGNGISDIIAFTDMEYAARVSLGNDVNDTLGFLAPFSSTDQLWLEGVLAGDFNGNGLTDLALHSQYGLEVQYARGRETPFSPPMELSTLGTADAMAVGDLNLSGAADIVIAQGYTAAPQDDVLEVVAAEVRAGVPTGRFHVTDTLTIGVEPTAVAVADVTGNGWLDILVSSNLPGTFAVIPGSAAGFGAAENYSLSLPAASMAVGDVTGNGALDVLLTPADTSGWIEIRENDGSGGFSSTTMLSIDEQAFDLELADLDGDGTLDLVYRINDSEDSLRVRNNDGSGNFGTSVFDPVVTASFVPLGVKLGDVSGNGHVDIVSWGIDSDTNDRLIAVWEGRGDGSFASETLTVLPIYFGTVVSLALGDVTHNGMLDVAIGDAFGSVHLLYNDGELGFVPPDGVAGTTIQGDFPGEVILADICGNGLLDVIWTEAFRTRARIAFGTAPIHTPLSEPSLDTAQTLGSDVLVESANRFGEVRNENRLVRRQYMGTTAHGPAPPEVAHLRAHTGFVELLRETSGLAVPAQLEALGPAYVWEGDKRLARIVDPGESTDTRLRLGERFGPRLEPESSTNMARAGLDMSSTVPSEQRAVILELPIDEAIDAGDIDAGTVRVFLRATDWTRAEAFDGDPLFGSSDGASLLPRLLDGADWRDVMRPQWEWIELTEDPSGNLSDPDGVSGPRFVVDQSASPRVIRVATDRLGAIQAFLDD